MIKKLINKLQYLWKRYVLKDKFTLAYSKWIKDKGDEKLRYDYPLNENSIVFDLGGYHGEFADKIYDKYRCSVYIFEPVKEFFEIIKEIFKSNQKIYAFDYGLSDKDESMEINISNDASSVHKQDGVKETINLKSITNFIKENNIQKIDLFKINIEGGEYEILPEIVKSDFVKNIDNLQIQFHDFIENAEYKREEIREELSKTHVLTYDYYFIWENWKKK